MWARRDYRLSLNVQDRNMTQQIKQGGWAANCLVAQTTPSMAAGHAWDLVKLHIHHPIDKELLRPPTNAQPHGEVGGGGVVVGLPRQHRVEAGAADGVFHAGDLL